MKITITNNKIDFDGIFKAYLKTNPSPYPSFDGSSDSEVEKYIKMWENWCEKNYPSGDDYVFDDPDDKETDKNKSYVESELDEAKCIFLYQDSTNLSLSSCITLSTLAALDDYLGNTDISVSAAEAKTLMNNFSLYCTIIKTNKQPFLIATTSFQDLKDRAETLTYFYSKRNKNK